MWASASADGSVVLVSPATGKEARVLGGREAAVGATCFSPNGSTLAIASSDGTLVVRGYTVGWLEKMLAVHGCGGLTADAACSTTNQPTVYGGLRCSDAQMNSQGTSRCCMSI